jgi:UDP-N-acetylmuramyl pentapeptide phosphotransferase/UDP-N-acetylglucosamine-1-phosphate transferase
MLYQIAALLTSFLLTYLIVKSSDLHLHLSSDHEHGPQKLHSGSIPRIGGLGIYLSLLFVVVTKFMLEENSSAAFLVFFACTIPCFVIGIREDITKKVGVKLRLLFTAISALIGIYFLDGLIYSVDLPIVDDLLKMKWFCYLFTIFAITGISNAYNIIDGLNGLAGVVGIVSLLAIYYVAYLFGDTYIIFLAQILICSILGFLFLNFPKGKIFLGDAGAYLIGFCSGFLSLLLVDRHSEISPWFALLINFYPIFETLYSIFRRKINKNQDPTAPDAEHFHSLVYFWLKHRPIGLKIETRKMDLWVNNARSSAILWILPILCAVPAVMFFDNPLVLKLFSLLFIFTYIFIYRLLIRSNSNSVLAEVTS